MDWYAFIMWAPWVTIFYLILVATGFATFHIIWLIVAIILDIIGYAT